MQCKRFTRNILAVLLLALVAPAFAFAADPIVSNEPIVPALARISWSAIAAGLIIALAVHMSLSTLGLGIGIATIDPYDKQNPTKGAPITVMVWMFVSGLVSLFIGGWVSGRLAGTVPFDSTIHGVITWAFSTVALFFFATTSLGYVVGGTFRILGQGASSIANAAATVVPEAAKMAKDAVADNIPQLDWKGIQREAKQLLQANGVGDEQEEIGEMLTKAYSVARDNLASADRDDLLKLISTKTGVSKEEATKTVEKWEKMYAEAKQKYNQALVKAEQTARETADAAKTLISQVAIWTFASLVFGMAVAGLSGNLGSAFTRL
jgi:hypothetical protein